MKTTSSCILLVDIGNTSITVGRGTAGRVCGVERTPSDRSSSAQIRRIMRRAAGSHPVSGVVLCSVVPALGRCWIRESRNLYGLQPTVVTHKIELGVSIDYPKPETIGADRLANACAAVARYGAPVVVADFGTALTFDVISKDAAYIGGVIAPGLPVMTDYLAERTALLPRIKLKGPHGHVGKSTVTAMRIGGQIGYRGMVREIINYLADVLGKTKPKLCATGGFAHWVLDDLDMPFAFEPKLTLYGLYRIHELNKET